MYLIITESYLPHRAWLYEHNSHHLRHLTARIETLLGVSAQEHVSAEAYQVFIIVLVLLEVTKLYS